MVETRKDVPQTGKRYLQNPEPTQKYYTGYIYLNLIQTRARKDNPKYTYFQRTQLVMLRT